MSIFKQIAITSLLVAAIAAGWLWLPGAEDKANSGQSRGPSGAGTLVLVEPVALAEDRAVVRVVGTGKALKSASIFPSVSGEVAEVLFDADQRVEEGQPLLRLDDKHERLAVSLAEVTERETLRELKRLEKLAPSGTVSVVRLEEAQAAYESARLRVQQSRAALDDRTIDAPFEGIMGMTDIDKGDRLTEDTVISTLDDRTVILVEFSIPEDYASRIKVGSPVKVRPWTMPDRLVEGTIAATGSRIDSTSRSLRVRAQIPNADDSLRPGTSFEVELTFVSRPYPSVREVAILWSRDGAYLWRVTEGKAEKVFVKIISRDKGKVLVKGPLEAGELIVVEGVQGLRPGQALDPRPFGESLSSTKPEAGAAPAGASS